MTPNIQFWDWPEFHDLKMYCQQCEDQLVGEDDSLTPGGAGGQSVENWPSNSKIIYYDSFIQFREFKWGNWVGQVKRSSTWTIELLHKQELPPN